MIIERFEDIIAWQKGKELTLDIYRIFNNCTDFGLVRQIQRAVVSIMNNIAEGFERGTNKEFRRYLFIAKGSCAEVRSMLYLAVELKYISQNDFEKCYAKALEISRLLSGFIKTL
ncbi:MAG: four helix bundle protein [Candidatus Buchananbacteria bacterium RBG_13_39_9]|uniref:Four helix bundle protein n=1 Tax=Candidatus Buchananbacteria bacterium RBG_13_39_9 TaxID=1797531 RepID=A0A1G1XQ29_9BACT|nr:MAG: four helix bundle protein [Candidatus Buchananbacteria bacterium RBG_13_39_9]